MVSCLPRGISVGEGTVGASNMDSLLATDSDLSLCTLNSGEPSRESEMAVLLRCGLRLEREVARSATDGEREGSLPLPTEKNVAEGATLRVELLRVGTSPGVVTESISKALIL
jgi:hypothetical protein